MSTVSEADALSARPTGKYKVISDPKTITTQVRNEPQQTQVDEEVYQDTMPIEQYTNPDEQVYDDTGEATHKPYAQQYQHHGGYGRNQIYQRDGYGNEPIYDDTCDSNMRNARHYSPQTSTTQGGENDIYEDPDYVPMTPEGEAGQAYQGEGTTYETSFPPPPVRKNF